MQTLEKIIDATLMGADADETLDQLRDRIATAVHAFLGSEEVGERAARRVFDTGFHPDDRGRLTNEKWAEWPHEQRRARNAARAALSFIMEVRDGR